MSDILRMKTLLCVCILAMVAGTTGELLNSITELEGTWAAVEEFPTIFESTDQGPGVVCVDQLTPECKAELPGLFQAITFENNIFVFNSTQFVGIDTKEKAAEAFPICAASGVFPLQVNSVTPPFQIVNFDPLQGKISFIDPRRPNDIDCGFISLEREGNIPAIRFQFVISFNGTLAEFGENGSPFSCERRPGLCSVKTFGNRFDIVFYRDAVNPCVAGPCLNLPKPAVVSKKHFIVVKKTSRDEHED